MRAKRWLAVLVVVFAGMFSASVYADDKADASAFVNNLGKQALSVVKGSQSDQEKESALEKMFQENVDIDWIAKFVVGRNWKAATPEQQQKYLANYKAFLIAHYTSDFAKFTNANFEVTRVVPDNRGGQTVTMRIKRPQQEDVIAEYTVKKNDAGQFKVYDIIVEGVSMITTQRSDFSSAIAQNGFDYLINQLGERSKTKQ
ncbi:MAG TPA: ABC transporter substrate-binding protein [Rickettsiales bacterium]|nr:ABC transporter substrate-binding protein [Rickettsiales bacterium]